MMRRIEEERRERKGKEKERERKRREGRVFCALCFVLCVCEVQVARKI